MTLPFPIAAKNLYYIAMEKNNALEELLNEEGIRITLEKIRAYGKYEENEEYAILITLAFLENGSSEALNVIRPLYEKYRNEKEMAYWYASSLLFASRTLEEYIEAKGALLDALEMSLEGEMENDALRKLAFAEDKISGLMTK